MFFLKFMSLTPEEIKKIALLAKLPITDEEATHYAAELSPILSYMDVLKEVDTSTTKPTAQVTGLTNITHTESDRTPPFSTDIAKETLATSELSKELNQLKVPHVL